MSLSPLEWRAERRVAKPIHWAYYLIDTSSIRDGNGEQVLVANSTWDTFSWFISIGNTPRQLPFTSLGSDVHAWLKLTSLILFLLAGHLSIEWKDDKWNAHHVHLSHHSREEMRSPTRRWIFSTREENEGISMAMYLSEIDLKGDRLSSHFTDEEKKHSRKKIYSPASQSMIEYQTCFHWLLFGFGYIEMKA